MGEKIQEKEVDDSLGEKGSKAYEIKTAIANRFAHVLGSEETSETKNIRKPKSGKGI